MNFIFRVISLILGKTIIGQLLDCVTQGGTFQMLKDSFLAVWQMKAVAFFFFLLEMCFLWFNSQSLCKFQFFLFFNQNNLMPFLKINSNITVFFFESIVTTYFFWSFRTSFLFFPFVIYVLFHTHFEYKRWWQFSFRLISILFEHLGSSGAFFMKNSK